MDNYKLSCVMSGIANTAQRGLLILLFFALSSCTFEPDELFINPTTPDKEPPEVYAASLDLEADTIYIYTDKTIEFKFVSSDQEIRLLIWYLNGQRISSAQSDEGVFFLNFSALSAGFHELSIELYTMSGTGSIAEAVSAEGFLFEKQWILYVIRFDGLPVSYSVEDGRLRLDWSPYPADNLKEYRITYYVVHYDKTIVGTSNTHSFIDSIYVGQSATFVIHAITTNNEVIFWGGCSIPWHAPPLVFNSNEQNEYWLSWSGCLYYNNIDSLKLYRRKTNEPNYQLVYESGYIPELIYNIDYALFGESIEYRLEITAQPHYLPDIKYHTMIMYNNIRAGYRFYNRTINGTIKAIGNDQIIFDEGGLVKFCLNDLLVKEKFVYKTWGTNATFQNLTVSPQSSFYVARIIWSESILISGPIANLPSSKTVNQQLFPSVINVNIPVSDNGKGMVRTMNAGFYLYDFINLQIIKHYNQSTYQVVSISSCGEYMIIRDKNFRLLTLSNNNFQQLMEISAIYNSHFEFSSVIPEQFIHWDGSTMRIINAAEQSIIISYPLIDNKIYSVDFYNNQILTSTESNLLVRNLLDGSILHSIDVPIGHLSPHDMYSIFYNLIVSKQGVLYFLQTENQ